MIPQNSTRPSHRALWGQLAGISRAPHAFVRRVLFPSVLSPSPTAGNRPEHATDSDSGPTPLAGFLGKLQRTLAPNDRELAGLLCGSATVLLVASLFQGFALPLTPGRMQRAAAGLIADIPLWTWFERVAPAELAHAPTVALGILLSSASALLAYLVAVVGVWNREAKRRSLVLAILASTVLLQSSVWYLPNVTTDLFNYILRGRIAAVHHENPYTAAGDEFSQDPIYPYASHRYTTEPGGKFPTWMLINIALAKLAGDEPVNNILVYRAAFFAFSVANLTLIASILARMAPRRVLLGVVLFGFNPVVVTFGQSKTDTVIVFFLLLSIWFLSRAKTRFGIVALGASVFVKMITAPLVVVHLLRQLRTKGFKQAAWGTGLLVITVGALYLPFTKSPDLLLSHVFVVSERSAAESTITGVLAKGGLLLLTIALGLRRKDGLESLIRAYCVILLYFALFFTNFAMSWYTLSVLAVASLLGDWRLTSSAVGLTFLSFVLNTWSATSSSTFLLPSLPPISRHLFIAVPVCALAIAVFTSLMLRRTMRPPGPQEK